MSRQLEFEKIRNIRDLGGMKTSGGKHIKSGKLIRCGQLSDLSESDLEKMAGIVDMSVDFRTEKEREEKPDVSLSGVSYRHIPIVDNLSAGISREEDADRALMERLLFKPEAAKMYMCDMYRSFVSETSLSQYESFFRLLLNRYDKAVLWHCTAGKDRAGIASAIVEKLLDILMNCRKELISMHAT